MNEITYSYALSGSKVTDKKRDCLILKTNEFLLVICTRIKQSNSWSF